MKHEQKKSRNYSGLEITNANEPQNTQSPVLDRARRNRSIVSFHSVGGGNAAEEGSGEVGSACAAGGCKSGSKEHWSGVYAADSTAL
jgi:hypothetical protein